MEDNAGVALFPAAWTFRRMTGTGGPGRQADRQWGVTQGLK